MNLLATCQSYDGSPLHSRCRHCPLPPVRTPQRTNASLYYMLKLNCVVGLSAYLAQNIFCLLHCRLNDPCSPVSSASVRTSHLLQARSTRYFTHRMISEVRKRVLTFPLVKPKYIDAAISKTYEVCIYRDATWVTN